MGWQHISSAPTKPAVGARGEIILGCDAEGRIGRTFHANGHPRGDGWLLIDEAEHLLLWEPNLWCHLPEKYRDRDGVSYASRKIRGSA